MPKTASATEVKVQLGAMMNWAVQHADEVIIESHGKPKAVLMSYAEFKQIERLREAEQQQAALARLEALAERTAARNRDLTQEAADDLAQRFTREVVGEMLHESKAGYGVE